MSQTINKKDLIYIRDYRPEDHNFIMATFLRGLFYGDSWFSLIPKSIFMANYHPIAERLLKGAPTIKVACLKEDPNTVLGYSIYRTIPVEDQNIVILDWVFCKSAWRGIGIGKDLLPGKVHAVTHLTKQGKSMLPKLGAIFNPFT